MIGLDDSTIVAAFVGAAAALATSLLSSILQYRVSRKDRLIHVRMTLLESRRQHAEACLKTIGQLTSRNTSAENVRARRGPVTDDYQIHERLADYGDLRWRVRSHFGEVADELESAISRDLVYFTQFTKPDVDSSAPMLQSYLRTQSEWEQLASGICAQLADIEASLLDLTDSPSLLRQLIPSNRRDPLRPGITLIPSESKPKEQ